MSVDVVEMTSETLVRQAHAGRQGSTATWTDMSAQPSTSGANTIDFKQIKQVSPITIDPNIRGGIPCVGPAKIPITSILKYFARGLTSEQIQTALPGLSMTDIQTALDAASWVMRDLSIDWKSLNLSDMLNLQDEISAWEALGNVAMEDIEQESNASD